jgi:hypothetical protein
MKILTKDANGKENGYLVTLWNCNEHDWRPDQVYVTVIDVGCVNGPDLHRKRCGRFKCIAGNVEIITRRAKHPETNGLYQRQRSGDDYEYALIEVPPGVPSQIRNVDSVPAIVINMPTPAWRPDDQDEWKVEEWNP